MSNAQWLVVNGRLVSGTVYLLPLTSNIITSSRCLKYKVIRQNYLEHLSFSIHKFIILDPQLSNVQRYS